MSHPPGPWKQLAHDLRGPLGVVRGAVDELEGDETMKALALRGTRQLEHLAHCWDLLGEEQIRRTSTAMGVVVVDALELFGELEPRRRSRIELKVETAGPQVSIDADRVKLGLVRLFSYLVRATREPIQVATPGDGRVAIVTAAPFELPEDLSPEALWPTSSRLATAVGLLAPITARWERADGALTWVPDRG